MKEQRVTLTKLTETLGPIEYKDKFEFRPEMKWKWVQKLCFWLLRKIGAFARGTAPTYTRIEFRKDIALQAIMDHYDDVWMERGRQPTRIIIGDYDFAYIRRENPYGVYFDFTAEHPRLRGMEVTVVPWMRGFVVLP